MTDVVSLLFRAVREVAVEACDSRWCSFRVQLTEHWPFAFPRVEFIILVVLGLCIVFGTPRVV